MKKFALILCAALVAIVSCTRIDDLENRVDAIDSRLVAIEETIASLNGQIKSMDALVNSIANGGYIKEVKTEEKNGINYYTLVLSNDKEYVIHDGATGKTPMVGVKKDADGNFYWTIDGQFTDPKVKVNGEDGKTPEIKVEGEFLVITWPGQDPQYHRVQGEAGKDGDSFFKNVQVTDSEVVFTLADGTSFSMSLIRGFRLIFTNTSVGVSANTTVNVPYQLQGVNKDEEVVVYVKYVAENWVAAIDEAKSEVVINVPANPEGGLVVVEAVNNTTSQVSAQALRFEAGVLTAATLSYEIEATAGNVEVPINTNMSYKVAIDVDWLKHISTKAPKVETLVFAAEANPLTTPRTANVTITASNGGVVKVVVLQKAAAAKEPAKIGDVMTLDGGQGVVAFVDETGFSGYIICVKESARMHFASGMEEYTGWPIDEVDFEANYSNMVDYELPCLARSWASSCGKSGWRLPAKQQMYQIMQNRSAINKALKSVGGAEVQAYETYWTSTTTLFGGKTQAYTYTYSDGEIIEGTTNIVTGYECTARAIHKFVIK